MYAYAHAEYMLARSCSRFSFYHQLRLEVVKVETRKASTSQVRGGIRLPSLQRRRNRDGQLALGLPAGKAACEAGIQVPASAEVLLFSI